MVKKCKNEPKKYCPKCGAEHNGWGHMVGTFEKERKTAKTVWKVLCGKLLFECKKCGHKWNEEGELKKRKVGNVIQVFGLPNKPVSKSAPKYDVDKMQRKIDVMANMVKNGKSIEEVYKFLNETQ